MKKYRVLFFTVLIFALFFAACSTPALQQSSPTEGQLSSNDLPVIKGAKQISISQTDTQRYIEKNFGYEMSLYANELFILSTDKPETELEAELEKTLLDKGWRLEMEFPVESWRKDTRFLLLQTLPEISTDTVDQFRRSFGVQGLEAGKTLLVVYLIDEASPLPNLTATAEYAASVATGTAWADSQAATAQAYEQAQAETATARVEAELATATARAEAKIATATAEAEAELLAQTAVAQTATAEAAAAMQQATQAAIEAQIRAENARATATALEPILQGLGTEFDGEDSIPSGWKIAREDPTRWDLTSRPGWLHIRGRYSNFYDDNWVPKNIFLYPLTYDKLTITTRVDADFDTVGQNVFIGLTPNDYNNEVYALQLGIALGRRDGRVVFFWTTNGYESTKSDYEDPIEFKGPVYLKLDISGTSYMAYYSEDGQSWIYLGESQELALGDKLMLGAGGGDAWEKEREFDGYFDLLRFGALTQ